MTILLNARDRIHGPDDVWIDRRSPWGNPFRIGPDGDRIEVIRKHREWFLADEQADLRRELESLRGKRLVCWCSPLPCHGDLYIWWLDERENLHEWLGSGS